MSSNSARDAFLTRLQAWATEQQLFAPGERVLLAVSGGPDSTALLCALATLRPAWALDLSVAHVHHHLRGAAADEDHAAVEALACEWSLPCLTERLVWEEDRVAEAAAREARYAALLALARRAGATTIALGHTLDDHVETILMWLLRGTGLQGLQGIPVVRPLAECRLVRPLRGVWRAEVETWLRAHGRAWRVDATNTDPRYLRNRIRHELLPLLMREYNAQIKHALAHLADTAALEGQSLEAQAAQWLAVHAQAADHQRLLALSALCQQPKALQQAILRQAARQLLGDLQQLTFQHWREVEALLASRPDQSVVDWPRGLQWRKDGATLIVRHRQHPACTSPRVRV